uniref:PX domain-containing protein n=1 Tax=Steinernema glaseri TaxID=37863 RepID=A0A1I8AAN0_9BILA
MIAGDDVLTVSDDEQLEKTAETNGAATKSKLVVEEEVDLGGPAPVETAKLTSLSDLSQNGSLEEPRGRLTITITGFEKRGDGINAYLVYKVVTRADNVIGYSNDHYDVWRRFSDFLGLHEKLVDKFQHEGIPIPCAPEKSIAALTKTKLNGNADDQMSNEIGDRRSRALQRFLRRIAKHPRLASDCDFRDFLTLNVELPKANSTSALSGASMRRMFRSVTETFSKITTHMDESDSWFEQAQQETDEFEELLGRMISVVDGLVAQRRELSHGHEALAKSMSMLASCEENTSLAHALSHLHETHENVALLEKIQAEKDAIVLSETLHEHQSMITALKNVLNERVKVWHKWQTAQQTLTKKREIKARCELAGKLDKAAQLREELSACERNVDDAEKEFKDVSAVIREEYERFHKIRKQELSEMFVAYMETLIETQEKVLKHWEKFGPESQLIITTQKN